MNVPLVDLVSQYQELREELDAAVLGVLSSGMYTTGGVNDGDFHLYSLWVPLMKGTIPYSRRRLSFPSSVLGSLSMTSRVHFYQRWSERSRGGLSTSRAMPTN